jgi:protoporphyrinogen oxidase
MVKPKVAIIGAGISGLFAAKLLAEKSAGKIEEIVIFEKESIPGGLITSTHKDNRVWDNGIFIFFEDSPLVQLFPGEFSIIEDHAQLAWNGKSIQEFPLSINTILKSIPINKIGSILADYVISRLRLYIRLTRPNFHDWLRYRLTKTILEYSMLENYIVKLQGTQAIELSDSLGKERFSDIDSSTKPLKLLVRLYKAKLKSKTIPKARPMYYFTKGAGSFSHKLAELCVSKGIKISYNSSVTNITKDHNGILNLEMSNKNGKSTYRANFVVATNPLNDLWDICKPFQQNEYTKYEGGLSFKPLLLILYVINKPAILNRHLLLYSLVPNQPWKRLKAHSQSDNTTQLIVEALVDSKNAESADSIEKSVRNSLIDDLKLFEIKDVLTIEYRFVDHAYPVYKLGFEKITKSLSDGLEMNNIFLCGRQGAFRYFSSDKSILSAINAVNNVMNKISLR